MPLVDPFWPHGYDISFLYLAKWWHSILSTYKNRNANITSKRYSGFQKGYILHAFSYIMLLRSF
jgi:hypothetical protein